MIRKKLILVSLLMMLLLLVTDISYAQYGKLVINAPENATVDEEITITVTCEGVPIENAIVSIDGIPIGETDNNGQIRYTFNYFGIYLITARNLPYYISSDPFTTTIEKPLLTVSINPLVPYADEEVTITVKANYLYPVEGATIYVKEDVIGGVYTIIGVTDSLGQMKHTFNESGTYYIKADKEGYIESLPYLLKILEIAPLLTISFNPLSPYAEDEVTITVKTNYLNSVVGATVYVKKDVINGIYNSIGTTDSNGQLVYIFKEGGNYLIKAEKSGCISSAPKTLKVLDVIIFEHVRVQGAVFPIPDSLENELLRYEELPFYMPYTSLLAFTDSLFVVFSNTRIEKGLANVEGWKLTDIDWEGIDIGVIQADKVSVEKEGMEVSFDDIMSNPNNFVLKLVKIRETIRQCSVLVDLDNKGGFRIPVTVGRILKDPIRCMDFTDLPEKAYELSKNFNKGYLEQALNFNEEGLSVFDFEMKYWVDCNATVNAIVLYPALVKKFVGAIAGDGVSDFVVPSGESILLYNVDTEFESIDTTVRDIKMEPERYIGKTVSIFGSGIGVNISVQETLQETQGIYTSVDLILHGFVLWCNPPPVLDDIWARSIGSVGVSSYYQDKSVVLVDGSLELFRYTGKLVSGNQVNSSLNGVALILFEKEKIGDISIEEINSELKDRIQGKLLTVRYVLQRESPFLVHVPVILSELSQIIKVGRGIVNNIILNLRNKAENVTVFVLEMDKKPCEVSIITGRVVYGYFEINAVNVSDGDVENVVIEFKVNRSWFIEGNVDESSVSLCRFSNGFWYLLSTSIVSESSGEIHFSAESPGFSLFAIVGEKLEISNHGESDGSSGFEVLLVVIAVGLVLFLKRKKMG